MPPRTPSLSDVISIALDERLGSLFTARPGRVVAFDEVSCTVSVQPLVRQAYTREDGTRATAVLPVIHNVPVLFHGAGANYGITVPLDAGVTGLILFCDSSLDQWKGSRGDQPIDPRDDRDHTLGDAVFLPGLRTMVTAREATAARVANSTVTLHGPKVLLGGTTGTESVVRASDLENTLKGVLSDPAVAAGITAVGLGLPGAEAALPGIINTYFAAHPVSGSSVVEAK